MSHITGRYFATISIDANAPGLHRAANENKLDLVKSLLTKGQAISGRYSWEKLTPLHYAALQGHLEMVRLLVERGAKIGRRTNQGFTPLHLAIHQKHLEISQLLIDKGADVNARDDQDWTPSHYACFNGFSLDLVKCLVSKGANVHAKTKDGRSSLHLAVEFNHFDIIGFLIQKSGGANSIDKRRFTPLQSAVYEASLESAQLLIDEVSLGVYAEWKHCEKTTLLHFASDYGHLAVVELLLNHGADVNAQDDTHWTPLHFATEKGRDKIVELLLKNKADPNMKNAEKGATPLHFASDYGHLAVVELLLEYEADVNAQDNTHWTPLHFAAERGYHKIVDSLLKHKADPNMKNGESKATPLHFAVQYKHPKIVDLLLARGSDVDSKTDVGATALHLAALFGNLQTVKTLLTYGAQFDARMERGTKILPLEFARSREIIDFLRLTENLYHSVMINDPDKTKSCIARGAIVDARCRDGRSMLHLAVVNQNFQIVEILLKSGADVSRAADRGIAPLHAAVYKGNWRIVDILLKHVGSEQLKSLINATTIAGDTPLHIAVDKGYLYIAKSLLKSGAIYSMQTKMARHLLTLQMIRIL